MKVAFVGNMNNNHFAMMRYFHALGIESYLFKYANEFDHFQPECDSFEIEKWAPYIIQTKIVNGDFKQYLKFQKTELHQIFKGFDFYIGNGMAPAYLNKAGIFLDVFIPYGVGIEYTYRVVKTNLFESIKEKVVAFTQQSAIRRNVGVVCTADDSTINKSISLGKKTMKYAIPMVYNLEETIDIVPSENVSDIIKKISSYTFSVFSHVSHVSRNSLIYDIKRNDVLIESFSKYINANPNHNSALFLLEYGDDVQYSKNLINSLGIESSVIWLPLMKRKELMMIIRNVSMGAGEFGGYFWGGTGWEFLSKGKLFFQFVDLDDFQLSEMISMPVPHFINTNNIESIAQKMEYYYGNNDELMKLGSENKTWFNKYAGIDLAAKYVALLK